MFIISNLNWLSASYWKTSIDKNSVIISPVTYLQDSTLYFFLPFMFSLFISPWEKGGLRDQLLTFFFPTTLWVLTLISNIYFCNQAFKYWVLIYFFFDCGGWWCWCIHFCNSSYQKNSISFSYIKYQLTGGYSSLPRGTESVRKKVTLYLNQNFYGFQMSLQNICSSPMYHFFGSYFG